MSAPRCSLVLLIFLGGNRIVGTLGRGLNSTTDIPSSSSSTTHAGAGEIETHCSGNSSMRCFQLIISPSGGRNATERLVESDGIQDGIIKLCEDFLIHRKPATLSPTIEKEICDQNSVKFQCWTEKMRLNCSGPTGPTQRGTQTAKNERGQRRKRVSHWIWVLMALGLGVIITCLYCICVMHCCGLLTCCCS